MKENWRREEAVFITKPLSLTKGLSFGSAVRIVAWAGVHSSNEDAIFRLSRVSRWFSNYRMTRRFTWVVSTTTEAIFAHLLSRQELSQEERYACSILFGNLAKSDYPHDENWPLVVDVFCAALRRGAVIKHIDGLPIRTWPVMLHSAFQLGLLDPTTDQAAMVVAQELMRKSMSREDYVALLSSGELDSPLVGPDAR